MTIQEQFKEALRLEAQSNFTEALQLYTQILRIDNSYRPALINLGSLYYRMEKLKHAMDCFVRALEIKEDYIVLFNIGSLYFRLGEYKKCIITLNQCNKQNPNFFIAFLVKGIAFSRLHNYKAALGCFKEVIKKNPSNRVALTALILLHYEQNNYADALRYLQQYDTYHASFRFKDIAADIILHCTTHNEEKLVSHSLQKKEFKQFDEYIATIPPTIFNDTKGTIDNKIQQLEKEIENKPTAQALISLSLCHLFVGNNYTALQYLAKAAKVQ